MLAEIAKLIFGKSSNLYYRLWFFGRLPSMRGFVPSNLFALWSACVDHAFWLGSGSWGGFWRSIAIDYHTVPAVVRLNSSPLN